MVFLMVIACLVGVLVLALLAGAAWDRFVKPKGDTEQLKLERPLPVKLSETPATRRELKEVEDRIELDLEGIRAQIDADRKARDISFEKVHNRIDAVLEKSSTMDGKLDTVGQNVTTLLDRALNGK